MDQSIQGVISSLDRVKGEKTQEHLRRSLLRTLLLVEILLRLNFRRLRQYLYTKLLAWEGFFQMIVILKKVLLVDIRLSVVRLPPGKRFSVCPSDARTTCAIVQLTNGSSTSYIIEEARPISTLMLRPTGQL